MKIIVSFSGGKDSQACLIQACKEFGADKVTAVFCDTGWEHELTYRHINDVTEQLGVPLEVLRNKSVDGFIGLCKQMRWFPDTMHRTCTVKLKIQPMIDYILEQDDDLVIIQGIRAAESASRSKLPCSADYFAEYFTDDKKRLYRKTDVRQWCQRHKVIWDKINRPTGFLDANRRPLRIHEDIAVFYKSQPTYNPQMSIGTASHRRGAGGNAILAGGKNRCYGGFKQTNPEYSNEKFPTSIIAMDKEHSGNEFHPTQKPVDLLRYLVLTYTNPGEVVLDNCMGSGTTAIACIREHRHFLGFELNKEYYDKAVQRIERERQQLTLF